MTAPALLHPSLNPTSQVGTWEHTSLGQITIDPGRSAPRSYNCNACAASMSAPVAIQPAVEQVLEVHSQLITSELSDGNLAVYSPRSQSGVVVLNGSMRAILEAYSIPGTMTDAQNRLSGLSVAQLSQAVYVLTRCGILCEPVA